ncbi:MAG: methyltransferase domain-containing protein [Ktedonobacteraceae bacterium]|nr:methyltransferase domain-containing protein [Ktedonobacteraceae bacterium]
MGIADRMFGHPRGRLGWLGGTLMARLSSVRYDWTLELLAIQNQDHVLEIGFGHGEGIKRMTELAREGKFAGVDVSHEMLSMASRRNAEAIQAGRVDLHLASAEALPFANETFDKVLSTNSIQLWPDQLAGLRELRRVLKTGGRTAISLQPVEARTEEQARTIGEKLPSLLIQAGFRNVSLESKALKPMSAFCALGEK